MNPETKLRLRKWALMALRAIVWHVDEWLHAQEIALREELERPLSGTQSIVHKSRPAQATPPDVDPLQISRHVDGTMRRAFPATKREAFAEWEARRSGVTVVPKTRLERITAAEFDLRFGSR